MKNNEKKIKGSGVVGFFLLIIGISIGFAALGTTLNITGNATIQKPTWSVGFVKSEGDYNGVLNVNKSAGATATTAPSVTVDAQDKINFTVLLAQPGDYYEFTVKVKNFGAIPAELKLSEGESALKVNDGADSYTDMSAFTTAYPYASVKAVWVSGSDETAIANGNKLSAVEGSNERTLKVRVEFIKDITNEQFNTIPDGGKAFTVTVDLPFEQE